MNTTRRQVLRSVGIFGALFATRGLIACVAPSADERVGANGDALVTCGDVVIGRNHGHALVVSSEDVQAGVDKTYAIKGGASHNHDVTVRAADFSLLGRGGSVTVASTTVGGHSHSVTVTCAASAPADMDAGATTDAGAAVCPNGATAAAISANHGHTLAVPTADVTAATTKTYSIKGSSGHAHTVTISSTDFVMLSAGATITVTSSTAGGHSHVVKVICA